jgi:repressor LexA
MTEAPTETTTERRPLTKRQREVYDFIVQHRADYGYSPTVQAVCRKFDFRSKNGAMSHLLPLRAKGWLRWEPRCSRTMIPVEADA